MTGQTSTLGIFDQIAGFFQRSTAEPRKPWRHWLPRLATPRKAMRSEAAGYRLMALRARRAGRVDEANHYRACAHAVREAASETCLAKR